MRGNQVFFTDQTGLRRIEGTTVLAGSISFGADIGHHLTYASSVDRVFVSVISATCYIAVVNPDPLALVTTFNNALAYQFNYIKYVSARDLIYCTQSDGTNLWGRQIDPHTNAITGNFQFSGSAATEFQGGIAFSNNHGEIFVARQNNNPFLNSIEIFDATSLAFSTSMSLGDLTPNDMIYVGFNGLIAIAGSDNSGHGIVAFVDPAARAIVKSVVTNTASNPTALVYDSHRFSVAADCATELLFVDVRDYSVERIAKASGGLQMAYNADNLKIYSPMTGTSTVGTFL